MGLRQYADRLAGSYSGGNKRKLSVAVAMIGDPEVNTVTRMHVFFLVVCISSNNGGGWSWRQGVKEVILFVFFLIRAQYAAIVRVRQKRGTKHAVDP